MLPFHGRPKRRAGHAVALAVRPKVDVCLYAKALEDISAVLALNAVPAGLFALDDLGVTSVLDGLLGTLDSRRKELGNRLSNMAALPFDVYR